MASPARNILEIPFAAPFSLKSSQDVRANAGDAPPKIARPARSQQRGPLRPVFFRVTAFRADSSFPGQKISSHPVFSRPTVAIMA
jgi:hypothetical protein